MKIHFIKLINKIPFWNCVPENELCYLNVLIQIRKFIREHNSEMGLNKYIRLEREHADWNSLT